MSFWKKLIRRKESPKAETPQSRLIVPHDVSTRFFDAVHGGDADRVTALLESNSDLVFSAYEYGGGTPLFEAVAHKRKVVAELLLAHGAEVNAKDNFGNTPLHCATIPETGVMQLLLAHGADVNAKDNNGRAPLHSAAYHNHQGMPELLLANKAAVNAKDNHGTTPLHVAARCGHRDLVALLLTHGAEVNPQDAKGRTPLHLAGRGGHQGVAELLRRHGGHE